MTPRLSTLSGHFSIFGLAFFALKTLLGIGRQYCREKFAILSKKPQSHDTERGLLWANYPCSLYYESPEQSNHERFHWCAVNQTRSRHMKRNSNCFGPNWAVYFVLRAVLRLCSNTKPSANDNANAFYQGYNHVCVTESTLQRCSGTSTTSDRGLFLAFVIFRGP